MQHGWVFAIRWMCSLWEGQTGHETRFLFMKRRDFFKSGVVAAGAASAIGAMLPRLLSAADVLSLGEPPETVKRGDMIYRKLGRTGVEVSAIGLGGHHIGRPKSENDGIALIRSAVDRGITFMDNCWDYHDGGSEIRMGKALRDGYREKVFLMTKIDGRTKKAAAKQIEESLGRLQTDHIDLLQHHEVIRMEDPDQIFWKDGAMEAVQEAQKAGKIRFIGFTGHKDPSIHLRMLEVADANGFHFDAVQLPLNVMDAHFRSFAAQVVPELQKRGIGILGMKALGDGWLMKSGVVTAIECLHYALGLPTSVVITGCERMEILDQAITAATTFERYPEEKLAKILGRTRATAAQGAFELYKTTPLFDGTAKNPQWLGYPEQEA